MQQGMPMTYQSSYHVTHPGAGGHGHDDKGEAKPQNIVVGPVAAFVPIKMLGTNGGGFYGMNSAHPFENPTALTNFFTALAMMLFPFALVLMYGRMLKRMRHSVVIYGVMMALMIGTIVWAIYFDTCRPNPGLTAHPVARRIDIPSATAPGGQADVDAARGRRPAGRSASGQSRRQGTAFRDVGGRRLRRADRGRDLRRDQLRAGQPQSARRRCRPWSACG